MRPWPLEILTQSFEKRMADLAFGRFRPVLDLGQELGLDPYAAVGDLLGVGLCLPDQRLEPRLKVLGRCRIEAVVDLSGVNQLVALAPRQIQAIPVGAVEREAGDGQHLALSAGLLDPVVSPAG
jgi:hypothetical protein